MSETESGIISREEHEQIVARLRSTIEGLVLRLEEYERDLAKQLPPISAFKAQAREGTEDPDRPYMRTFEFRLQPRYMSHAVPTADWLAHAKSKDLKHYIIENAARSFASHLARDFAHQLWPDEFPAVH